eukprot:scaffold107868_cov29-Tisochrysis_lutea.AAC.4
MACGILERLWARSMRFRGNGHPHRRATETSGIVFRENRATSETTITCPAPRPFSRRARTVRLAKPLPFCLVAHPLVCLVEQLAVPVLVGQAKPLEESACLFDKRRIDRTQQ